MAEEMDLGTALIPDSPSFGLSSSASSKARPKSAVPKHRLTLHRVPSSSSTLRTHPKPSHQTHMKRRSSFGDGIGLQKDHTVKAAAEAATLIPSTQLAPNVLENFRNIALCFAVVNFDIDQGPVLAACYPHCDFSRDEQSSIAFTSLPDSGASRSTDVADNKALFSTFSWKIARDPLFLPRQHRQQSLYGYVNFMTRRDPALKRSYLQRSLVLITHCPNLHGLWGKVAELLSSVNDAPSETMSLLFEVASNSIAKWPVLEPGGVYELPFLDTLITAEIPLEDRPQFHHRNPSNLSLHHELVLGGNPSPPLSFVFQHHLSSLWSLWELVALSEPILVFATSDVPSISAAVTWLSLLCRPIRYSGEHRPSINIHMHDYPRFVNSSPPLRALILGTTSPLVFSSCRHWPHILRLCSSSVSKMTSGSAKPDGVLRLPPPSHKHVNESRSFKASIEHRNGLFTGHRRTIKKDHAVLKQAEEKVKAGQYSQADALLIQHFSDLSEKLLSPLNRYFSSLQPLLENLLETPAPITSFSASDFLSQLAENELPLSFKRNKLASRTSSAFNFYKKWLQCPAFAAWLRTRVEASEEVVQKRVIEELSNLNVDEFAETESSTRVSSLIDKLDGATRSKVTSGDRAGKLKLQAQRLRQIQGSSSEVSDSA